MSLVNGVLLASRNYTDVFECLYRNININKYTKVQTHKINTDENLSLQLYNLSSIYKYYVNIYIYIYIYIYRYVYIYIYVYVYIYIYICIQICIYIY